MSDKRPLLLFSGGLDSTYMLRTALMETDVDVLYIDCGQCKNKIQAESISRTAILRWMDDHAMLVEDEKRHRVRRTFDYTGVSYADAPNMMSSQAPVWLIGALYHFDPSIHSEVRVAYVMGDDALIYRHEMATAWENLCLLAKGVSVPLVFPLMGWRKSTILKYIQPDLLDLIWVCELPTWVGTTLTPCHKCIPCKRHDREMKEAFGKIKFFKERVKSANQDFKKALATVMAERKQAFKNDASGLLQDDVESSGDSSRRSKPIEPVRSKRKLEPSGRSARSQPRGEC